MELDYRRAIRLALGEKRLWAAGLLAALAFSEAWWVVFGWGPEYLGERWRSALAERLGGAGALAAFVIAALAAFVVLKGAGYLGEMVLVRQVADARAEGAPGFGEAFSSSRSRYIPFAATLLPWDALRTALIYLPTLIIVLWDRWDPNLDQVFLYIAVMLLWFAILVAAYFFGGVTAALAARFSLLRGKGIPDTWREGWRLLRGNTGACLPVWLQALAADIIFVIIAWPLSALLPWVASQIANPLCFAPIRWLIHLLALAILAGGLVVMQTFVQVFKSSLWTLTFLALNAEPGLAGEAGGRVPASREEGEETFQPPLTDIPDPPPGLMP